MEQEPLCDYNHPHLIWTLSAKSKGKKLSESQCLRGNVWYDDEIVGQFDPSRIPPRIAFRLEKARTAIIKEIDDLLTPHGQDPTAMLQISLSDPKYRGIARVRSTLVVKRKSVGVYKGRLCVRGDTVPIAQTAFASSPTANRCGVKIICLMASQSQWDVRALDISQAFLQAGNLNNHDRMIVLPPPMIKFPWKKSLHDHTVELKSLPVSEYGFLLLRPLYGGRDAPMRWFLKLSQVLTEAGLRQTQ